MCGGYPYFSFPCSAADNSSINIIMIIKVKIIITAKNIICFANAEKKNININKKVPSFLFLFEKRLGDFLIVYDYFSFYLYCWRNIPLQEDSMINSLYSLPLTLCAAVNTKRKKP